MKGTFILVLAILFSILLPPTLASGYTNVTVFDAKTMIDSNLSLVILDVRTQSEYESDGHIRNAKLIPVSGLAGRLDELDASDEILVYCKSGGRSATASQILVDNGFLHIYNMLGGITAWKNEGYAVYIKYSSIQGAINEASQGGAIYVSSGAYYENLVINKSISLIGENRGTTIIDGNGTGDIVTIFVDNTSLSDFTVQDTSQKGIILLGVSNTTLTHNIILNTTGIYLWYESNYNTISFNVMEGNRDNGISISSSNHNSICFNDIMNTEFQGIYLYNSSGNIILSNSITNSTFGIYVNQLSTMNYIYHNNMINNTHHAYLYSYVANIWDNDYEGNYWDDYNGSDLDGNGLGDVPYIIDENNTDYYPLVNPYIGHNIAIENLGLSKNIVGEGYSSAIEVNVTNLGSFPETFNLTVYANTSSINIQTFTISHLNSTVVASSWNTTGLAYGNYTISAFAEPVLGENDTSDNLFIDRWILITIAGDIDGDKFVNAKDAVALGVVFGIFIIGHPECNPNADINGDGWVNAKDAIILGLHFNESWA